MDSVTHYSTRIYKNQNILEGLIISSSFHIYDK